MGLKEEIHDKNLEARSQKFREKLSEIQQDIAGLGIYDFDRRLEELAILSEEFDRIEGEYIEALDAVEVIANTTTVAQRKTLSTAVFDVVRTFELPERLKSKK